MDLRHRNLQVDQHAGHGIGHGRRTGEVDFHLLHALTEECARNIRHEADAPGPQALGIGVGCGDRRIIVEALAEPGQFLQHRFAGNIAGRTSAVDEMDLPPGELRAHRCRAGDRNHRREAGPAGKAQDVAWRVLAQIGHAEGAVHGDRVAELDRVEQPRSRCPIRHFLDLEVPFLAGLGDVAHRISARSGHARHIEESILPGQEGRRLFQAEAEFADIVGVVLDGEQPARSLLRQIPALVMVGQRDFDLAIGERMSLAAEIALALAIALGPARCVDSLVNDFALEQFETAIAA